MMAWVSGNHIHIPLDQPITQEMLKGINRAYIAEAGEHVPRPAPPRMWCSTTTSWVPTPSPGQLAYTTCPGYGRRVYRCPAVDWRPPGAPPGGSAFGRWKLATRWRRMGRTTTSPSGCRPLEGHQSGVDQEVFAEVAVVIFASARVYIRMYFCRSTSYIHTRVSRSTRIV